MIISFGCNHTRKIWEGRETKKWNKQIANTALRKLFMLHAAEDLKDLMIPPSNRLHKLKGEMKMYWAICINDQWRIIFKWEHFNAHDVQIIDYH
ncbi:MAG: type II toxin-antitoxin system RelE/ParE family toxin [Bacteroidetes bacterium]|nr:type II toxin-antitoxin system RelE/ParE family toxin [Bacteroidota bacterium]MDA1121279.1 type II toxin-antitoxin system RelE/ParE family toxin [Bacteroidota bacterium]